MFYLFGMNSCIELCKTLSIKYNIPKENFIGHSDIAPDRKIDPGIFFDWELLYKYGLGVWHKVEPSSIDTLLYEFGVVGKNIGKIQSIYLAKKNKSEYLKIRRYGYRAKHLSKQHRHINNMAKIVAIEQLITDTINVNKNRATKILLWRF